jgi:hypothetical protein
LGKQIIEFAEGEPKLQVNVDLQEDFGMNQALSLYLLETLPQLDTASETYALDLLSLVESVLEDPDAILRKQLDRLKAKRVAELKAEGVEYEKRVEELSKLEYPKPLRDFIYDTFNDFADRHPWVGQENICPKSVIREMYETYATFADYVRLYDLQRSEGLLLRHLNSTYKALARTVPDSAKTDEVREMEGYLHATLRAVDSSLMDAWEKMQDPDHRSQEAAEPVREAQDLTADRPRFLASVRARVFVFVASLSGGHWDQAAEALDAYARREPLDGEGEPWTAGRLEGLMAQYLQDHKGPLLDPEGRNLRHTYSSPKPDDKGILVVQQMLVDHDAVNDWVLEFEIDLRASREYQEPVMDLNYMGELRR